MASLVILGAGGFVGRTLVSAEHFPMPVKAVVSGVKPTKKLERDGLTWCAANLSVSRSLDTVLGPGDIVTNLAYMRSASQAENERLTDNIIEACLKARVARLLHCSTAAVAGAAKPSRIFESTLCVPVTPYERTKSALELKVLRAIAEGLDVGILRPTTIVGRGGENLSLVKLACCHLHGNAIVNYLRASLFGKRATHLVSVNNVVAAVFHLAMLPNPLKGGIYHVSSDDDPSNNFEVVERVLLEGLGLRPRKVPLFPVPKQVLSLLLRLRGRSNTDVTRVYDNSKLLDTKFKSVGSVADVVREWGVEFRSTDVKQASDSG